MDVTDYIGFVRVEGERFVTAAEMGDMHVAIDACDDWNMRDLVRHLGLIHLWAAANVSFAQDDWLDADDIPDMGRYWPELGSSWPEDHDLTSWYRLTKDNLIRVLEEAPLDHHCFSFLPASTPVTMWSRRQASEIAIHRYDAEAARKIPSHFEPAFAADMLDELLSGFAPRPMQDEIEVDRPRILHVSANDVDEDWYLTLSRTGITTDREGGNADLTISGSASQLYLFMWNRTGESTVALEGDADLIDLWRSTCQVQWSGGE